jgi:hypothetical protein
MREALLNLFFGICVYACLWTFLHLDYLRAFPSIVSSFYSKQYCSCLYVMKASEEFCHDWTRQWLPISNFEHDLENSVVRVSGFGVTTESKFLGFPNGCQIQSPFSRP